MAQVKFYGLKRHFDGARDGLSDAVHSCVVEALSLPEDKRFHRFIGLEPSEFRFPPGRSERYTIIEFSMFAGRSVEAKKALIRLVFERLERELSIPPSDVEITIFETPKHNWGIRGVPADELGLDYKVEV